MKELILIDANALIHRAFHALPPLTSSTDGSPVGALYGISLVLMRLREEGNFEYAAALFDRPEPTFRKKKYAEYKATRKPAAEELIAQIIAAHDLFEIFGITVFEKAGYEADDCIATLTERFRKNSETQVTILTGDMDALQLVEDPAVRVRAFRKGVTDTIMYDEAGVKERLGVPPRAVVAYKALVGDVSDNIKGVSGIGPKTAADILAKHDTITDLYAHLDDVPKYKEKLVTNKEQAKRSEELVVLDRHVSLEVGDLESLKVAFDLPTIKVYFESLGFKKLVARLDGKTEVAKAEPKPKKEKKGKEPDPNQGSMF